MAHDLITNLEPVEHLLVVTPPNGAGRHGLQLAFRSATVIETSKEGTLDFGDVQRSAGLAAIEAPAGDITWTLRVINAVRPALARTALVAVIFPPDLVAGAERVGDEIAHAPGSAAEGSPTGLQVHSTGLVGDAVGVVLGPASSSGEDGLDASRVIATMGRVVCLETLAGPSPFRSPGALTTGEPPIAKRLRAEVHRLSMALESETESRERAEERYRSLLHSRLGRVTSRYWQLRKSFAGGPRR
jgi:hypothetical protein